MQVEQFKVAGDEITIAPIGDIQYGATGCDVGKLERWMDAGREQDWHFIGMGDYLDTHSPSNQVKLAGAGHYESTRELIDEAITNRVDDLAKILSHEGRWLGCVQGDHLHTFEDGQNSDHYLSRKLRTPFLGTAAFVLVKLEAVKTPLRLWVFHGKVTSNSNPTGLTLDFIRKQARFDADIYLMGHAHQLYGLRLDTLLPYKAGREWKIGHRDVAYAATGSFLNGWAHEARNAAGLPQGNYIEKGGFNPIPTGGVVINVKATQRYGRDEFEIRVTS
jgi:hypothetical protein